MPHTPADIAAWQAVGYTTEKLLDAGRQIIDAYMTAFPNQYVTLAVAGNGNLDPDVNYAARNALLAARTAWPGRLIVQKNSLATFNPPAPGHRHRLSGSLGQPARCRRPDARRLFQRQHLPQQRRRGRRPAVILHKNVNVGAGYNMNYIEIYQLDVLNLPAEITYAHNVLLGLAPPSSTPPPPAVPPLAPTGLHVQP